MWCPHNVACVYACVFGPGPEKTCHILNSKDIVWIKIENKPSQSRSSKAIDRVEVGALDFFFLSALRRRGEARW